MPSGGNNPGAGRGDTVTFGNKTALHKESPEDFFTAIAQISGMLEVFRFIIIECHLELMIHELTLKTMKLPVLGPNCNRPFGLL